MSRKIVCGYCGQSINGSFGTSKTGTKKYYYRCSGRQNPDIKCNQIPSLPKDLFENFIIKNVVNELSKPEVMNKLLDQVLNIQSNNTKILERIKFLEQEQWQAKLSLKNLISVLEKGITHQEIIDRIDELKEQIAALEKAIFTEKNKMDRPFKREQLQKYYCDVIKKNAKEIIEILIKEIRVYKDKIEIKLNTPLKKDPDNNQGSFYSTNYNSTTFNSTIQAKYYV